MGCVKTVKKEKEKNLSFWKSDWKNLIVLSFIYHILARWQIEEIPSYSINQRNALKTEIKEITNNIEKLFDSYVMSFYLFNFFLFLT
jgi:hypothetical protein